jgi:hypothetical protein
MARPRPAAPCRRPFARSLALLALLLPAGCGIAPGVLYGSMAGANAVSVAVIGRDIADATVSLARGQDCSVVRLDRGQSYCKPVPGPVEPPVYCTRSIGAVDCWREPPETVPPRRGVADQAVLTAQQQEYQARRWPYLW